MVDELTNQRDALSAADVRRACEAAGLTMTQLYRWIRAGYLVGPVRRGRKGQGRGTNALWPAETMDKARVIAAVARTGKGADVEIARALLLHGYDVPAGLLRKVLAQAAEQWEHLLTPPHRGRPRRQSRKEKQRRLNAAARRAAPQAPSPYLEIMNAAVLSLTDPPASPTRPGERAISYLSPGALRTAVTGATDRQLIEAWNIVGFLWPLFVPLAPLLVQAIYRYLGLPGEAIWSMAMAQLQAVDDDALATYRILSTAFVTAVLYYQSELIAPLAEALRRVFFPNQTSITPDELAVKTLDLALHALPAHGQGILAAWVPTLLATPHTPTPDRQPLDIGVHTT
jgi:hypothetical protein